MSPLPRVLIINSDPSTRALLRWLLHLHAEQVIEADGGVETPDLVRKLRPSVVVMDVCLRGSLSGYTLLRKIQELNPRLPVVVYTDAVSAERARRCGATRVLVQGEHQMDALLAVIQGAHDGCSSVSAPPGAGVAPARPAAGAGCSWSAGRAEFLAHLASATGGR